MVLQGISSLILQSVIDTPAMRSSARLKSSSVGIFNWAKSSLNHVVSSSEPISDV